MLLPELIPLILRLFPELLEFPLVGKAIPLFNVQPEDDVEVLRKLDEKIKRDTKPTRKDKTRVVKVSDVVNCVNDRINGKMLNAIGSTIIAVLKEQGNLGTELFNPIIECVRNKQLSQANPRNETRRTTIGRPARGHGHGRDFQKGA